MLQRNIVLSLYVQLVNAGGVVTGKVLQVLFYLVITVSLKVFTQSENNYTPCSCKYIRTPIIVILDASCLNTLVGSLLHSLLECLFEM